MTMVTIGEIAAPKQWSALPKSKMTPRGFTVYGANGPIGYADEYTHENPVLVVGCRGTIGAIHITEPRSYVTSNAMAIDSLDISRVSIRYLARFLAWRGLADVTSGSSQPQLTRQSLVRVEVPLVPLSEQHHIAAILDQSDALHAKRLSVIAQLDALAVALFFEEFGDPLTNSHGIRQATLGSVTRVVTGNSPSRANPSNFGTSIEWIKSGNLGGQVASRADEWLSDIGRSNARLAPAGSVLVTCIAGSPASIGKASIVDREVAFNQQINAVLPSSQLDTSFLLSQLKVAPELVRMRSTGGMKGLVNKSSFEGIEVLIPPLERQREFVGRLRHIASQRRVAGRALSAVDDLFAALQARAFSSEY